MLKKNLVLYIALFLNTLYAIKHGVTKLYLVTAVLTAAATIIDILIMILEVPEKKGE